MRTKLALLASTTLAALAFAGPAEAAGSGWYLSLTGGANWLSDDNFAVSTTGGTDTFAFDSNSDTGFIIGGAVGMSLAQVAPGLRAEVAVDYRQNKVKGNWASDTITSTPGNDSGTLDYNHKTFSVLANAWYDFDLGGFKPYVGGGLGWAETKLDGSYVGGTAPTINFKDNGFAWQLGAGVNFQIAPNMQLGVGYRYFKGPDVTLSAPDPANNSATGDINSDNHAATVTLTFGM